MLNTRRIKIRIKADGARINIPSIPLNFTVFKIVNHFVIKSKKLEKYNIQEFQNMIKPFFRELKNCPSFDLVDIKASDGTIVKITII